MDDNQPLPEAQPPSERAIIMAFVACFISLAFFYLAARRVIEPLEIGWVKFVIYAIVPMSMTFVLLYRSRWHLEITGAMRTCRLLLITCAISGVAILVVVSIFYVAQVLIPPFTNGEGPG